MQLFIQAGGFIFTISEMGLIKVCLKNATTALVGYAVISSTQEAAIWERIDQQDPIFKIVKRPVYCGISFSCATLLFTGNPIKSILFGFWFGAFSAVLGYNEVKKLESKGAFFSAFGHKPLTADEQREFLVKQEEDVRNAIREHSGGELESTAISKKMDNYVQSKKDD